MITLLLVASAFFAGIMNAVAGGGSFLTFPALIFAGIPPIAANATSSTALLPATFASVWAYRNDFERIEGLPLWLITTVSVVAGAIGAALLLITPESTFVTLIPWLLLSATGVFAFGNTVALWARKYFTIGPKTVLVLQFLISIYGGYFGGGIGILMLAAFRIFGLTRLNAMNAMKTWLSGCLNAIAVAMFIVEREVYWRETVIMVLSSAVGGYAGAAVGRRIDPKIMRAVIITIGVALSVYFFVK